MKPTIGRTVHYKLSARDADEINRRRVAKPHEPGWPAGAQAHVGKRAAAGDVCPMVITHVWSETTVNGQVFLDGNDQLWVTSVQNDDMRGSPGTWYWPPRE